MTEETVRSGGTEYFDKDGKPITEKDYLKTTQNEGDARKEVSKDDNKKNAARG